MSELHVAILNKVHASNDADADPPDSPLPSRNYHRRNRHDLNLPPSTTEHTLTSHTLTHTQANKQAHQLGVSLEKFEGQVLVRDHRDQREQVFMGLRLPPPVHLATVSSHPA